MLCKMSGDSFWCDVGDWLGDFLVTGCDVGDWLGDFLVTGGADFLGSNEDQSYFDVNDWYN